MDHDRAVTAMFEKRGWTVIRIWECEFKKKNAEKLAEKLRVLLSTKELPVSTDQGKQY